MAEEITTGQYKINLVLPSFSTIAPITSKTDPLYLTFDYAITVLGQCRLALRTKEDSDETIIVLDTFIVGDSDSNMLYQIIASDECTTRILRNNSATPIKKTDITDGLAVSQPGLVLEYTTTARVNSMATELSVRFIDRTNFTEKLTLKANETTKIKNCILGRGSVTDNDFSGTNNFCLISY